MVELLIVIAIIAIVATIGITNVMSGKFTTNQKMAVVTLRQIMKAESVFQEKGGRDKDADLVGEFAVSFDELTGQDPTFLSADVVGKSWINLKSVTGFPERCEKDGYIFQIYSSKDTGTENIDDDETQYAIVAWPKKAGKTALRCFAIVEDGQLLVYENEDMRFDGSGSPVLLTDFFGTPFDYSTLAMGVAGFTMME